MGVKLERWNKKENPDLVKLEKGLKKEGLQPYTFTSYPGQYYGEHSHEHDEVRILISGKMKFGIGSEEIILNVGDKLVVSKGTLHWAEVIGNENAVLLSASK